MTHCELWNGITNLAKWMNLSCSGLARASGLNATTFNPGKRKDKYGQNRWPTMYSISRVLDAAGITLSEFAKFMPSDTHTHPKYNPNPHKRD